MRSKKKNARVTSEGQTSEAHADIEESREHNKFRGTTLSELETFNIRAVNKRNTPQVSDYHAEM